MNKRVKHIIFDIGNVVLEWQPELVLRSVFAADDITAMLNKTFLSSEWLAYDQGILSAKELKEQMASNLSCPFSSIDALLHNVVITLRPIPEIIQLMQELKTNGYQLYALTNMPKDIFHSLFEEHKFWQLFEDIVVSSQVNLIKPNPAIFELLLTKNNLHAGECIFLDDNSDNVNAALKLGLSGITVTDPQQAVADLRALLAE